jgi:HPt (histidine-containing phosphotransfer) domain-containing protein
MVLTGFGGLDTVRGLAAARGNAVAYVKLLRQFVARHGEDTRHLRDELATGAIEAAKLRLHALKGVAGTLGATGIHGAAVALELALRNTAPASTLAPLVDALGTGQAALGAVIAGLPEVIAIGDKLAANPGRVRAVLKQLEPMLAADDAAAGDLFEANRALLMATPGTGALQLGRQLDDFNYPGALVTLRELIRQNAAA